MVIKSMLGPLGLSYSIILFILVIQTVFAYAQEIFGKGLEPGVLGQLVFYACGRMTLFSLPVAVLASALMAFGGMGENNELAAMKSCGMHLFQIMRGGILLTLALGLFCLWFSFDVAPRANLKFFSLLYDIKQKKADLALQPGYFYSDIDGYVIRISDKHKQNGTLYDVLIYNHKENPDKANQDIILADSARMQVRADHMRMILYHGVRHEEMRPQSDQPNSLPYGRTYFDSLIYKFRLEGFNLSRTDENQFRHQLTMRSPVLHRAIDSLQAQKQEMIRKAYQQVGRYNKLDSAFLRRRPPPADTACIGALQIPELGDQPYRNCIDLDSRAEVISRAQTNMKAVKSYAEFMQKKEANQAETERNYRYEAQQRISIPVSCLLFLLLGASLGAIIRKGGLGWPALISLVAFILFYVLNTYGRKAVKEANLEAWQGAWLPVMLIGPLALYFTYQATMETSLFNESAWMAWRERLGRLFRRRA
jgi:lipopolysaccharide export system permease protein